MRPRILKLTAFGSYCGETVIDFRDIRQGVFLITGDTGAGKTTIFDGITYALYGVSSGGRREASMMRSQYAKETVRTGVELEFESRGEIYRICRYPEYQRQSKRKNKDGAYTMTTERSAVEFYMPDGKPYPGKRQEIDRKVIEIIGVDAKQFSQIAMIAQGDFLKLLLARSDERKEIFSRIFDTQIYRRVQEILRLQVKQLYGELEDNRKAAWQEIGRLKPDTPDTARRYEELLLHKQEPDLGEAVRLAGDLAREDQAEYEKLLVSERENQRQWEALEKRLGLAREQLRLYDEWERAGRKVRQLLLEQEEQKERKQRLEMAKRAGQVHPYQAASQQADQNLADRAERIRSLEEWLYLHEEERKRQEEKMTGSMQLWEQMEKERVPAWQALSRSLNQYEKLKQALMQAGLHQIQWEQGRKAAADALEVCRSLAKTYEDMYDAYIREQAGVLAFELEEGRPCPVCGSPHHPQLARLSEGAPSKEQIAQIKEKRDAAEKEKEEAQKTLLALSEQMERERTVIGQLEEQLMGEVRTDRTIEERKTLAEEWFLLATQKEEQERKLLEQMKRQKEEDVRIYEELVREEQRRRGQLAENQTLAKEAIETAKQKKAVYQAAIERQAFTDEENYMAALMEENVQKELEDTVAAYESAWASDNHRYQILEEQLKAQQITRKPDLFELEEALAAAKSRRQQLAETLKKRYSRRESHQSVEKNLKKLAAGREQLLGQYEKVNTLSKTANGTVTGTVKIDFESYVQRQYFRQMIHGANQHLQKMVSGQFLLRCRLLEDLSTQGNAGLDLDVYSLVTGKTRDVKTLSGGESFMAALALALGMTDLITRTCGAVQVDTLFIDEGFGSLDEASREQAIRILQGLAQGSRLVGIISHVTELKDEIDRQLVVTKTRQGSQAIWK